MAQPSHPKGLRAVPVSRRVLGAPPATRLDDVVRLCDPFTPLDPEADASLHADLSTIRGGDRLAKIVRNIRRSGGIPTLHFLTGHLGSGKTTELLRMKRQLELAEGDSLPITVLFLDADAMLDRNDVDLEDILIALWSTLAESGVTAATKVLAEVWKQQVAGAVATTIAHLPDRLPEAVGKVLGELRLPSIEQRQRLRIALGSVVGSLLKGLNEALAVLRKGEADLTAVLIDNLEKLSQGQRAGVERLYLERMGALKDLDAHLVITVPLCLCYAAAGASLIGLYGGEVVVLPMIQVRRRASIGGGDADDGLNAMVDLLKRRVRFDLLFEQSEEAARRIARLSGGCIRHALRIVHGAANEHDRPPVTAASVERAAASVQADFERALPEAWVPHLRYVAQHNGFSATCPEDVKRDLLRHLFVLEYQNGEPDPWYAVHPLVERCRKYLEQPGS